MFYCTCVPVLVYLFLKQNNKTFLNFLKDKQKYYKAMLFHSRYVEDFLSLSNPTFCGCQRLVYMHISNFDRILTNLDSLPQMLIYPSMSTFVWIKTTIHKKFDGFNFPIVNFQKQLNILINTLHSSIFSVYGFPKITAHRKKWGSMTQIKTTYA